MRLGAIAVALPDRSVAPAGGSTCPVSPLTLAFGIGPDTALWSPLRRSRP
jgi:hypothetical protein